MTAVTVCAGLTLTSFAARGRFLTSWQMDAACRSQMALLNSLSSATAWSIGAAAMEMACSGKPTVCSVKEAVSLLRYQTYERLPKDGSLARLATLYSS